jgi:Protein of unknown function (DUF4232)
MPQHRRRTMRRAVLAVALAACPLVAAATTASAASVPRCGVSSLLGELRNPTAGLGSRFVTLVLTNVTRHRCSLAGYPGLRLLGPVNLPIATHVVRDHSVAPHTVVLNPGASARSTLRFGAIPGPGEPQSGACEPKPARVQVTPPHATGHLVLPWRLGSVCEHGTIDVRPVR